FDPNGGFVTGGGWIDSPPGAYVANPLLVGKANFGFNAKYKKGSNLVDGNTEFQFKAGDLNFKSSAHDAMSLVVAGFKAIYKGVGSINGNDHYAFMVSVEDGNLKGKDQADKFRIKIWDRRDGAIVYDNNVAVSEKGDDAAPATAIGGGSIVIHEVKANAVTKTTKLTTETSAQPVAGQFYNYPNMFTDRTTIAFSLEKSESYVLEVYDLRGALIKKVEAGTAEAGKLYEFGFDGSNLSRGMYVARLQTPSGMRSIKMILNK
ncbi:MAG TPA: T9SS type A sorting domain-containing protein, partial [Pontibacter sp.]